VKTADEEAAAVTAVLNEAEIAELRKIYGEGSSGKGLNKGLIRGVAGALKDLEKRQKSRATRTKRDVLDAALLDRVAFYRDVLAVQFGASVELASEDRRAELEALARSSTPEDSLLRIDAIMLCRERLAANVNPQMAIEAMTLSLRRPRA
ncbi:DNA polymerase III subunit delta', partial [Micromonospora harpali]